MPESRQLAAVLFTDIVGYSAIMQEDETAAVEKVNRFRQVLENKTPFFNGRIIQFYGDGCLLIFNSAVDAVGLAKDLQLEFSKDPPIPARIGIHIGDILIKDGNVFGDAVNIAARIQALAPPGGILISEAVQKNIANKQHIETEYLKTELPKNIKEPIRIYNVKTETAGIFSKFRLKRKQRRRNKTLVFSLFLIAVLIGGYFIYQSFQKPVNSIASVVKPETSIASIAVLPFKDNSATHDQEYLGNSIAEEILNVLNTTMKDLKVTGITSSFALKDSTLKAIGRILKVKSILEGSVQKLGNQVKVVVRLINEADEAVIWTETFERAFKDLFSLQNEIAVKVGEKLKLTFEGDINAETMTLNPDAYEMVLKGNFFFNQGPEGLKQAIEYHKKAISIDPEYGYPHIRLGWALYQSTLFGAYSSKEGFAMARKEIEKGLALTKSATEKESAHIALAYINLWGYRWKEAWAEYEKVLAINPKRTGFSAFYQSMSLGKPDTAIIIWKKEVDINPIDLLFLRDLALLQFQARRFSEIKETCRNMLELNSSFSEAHRLLGQVYFTEKKIDTALYHLKKAMDLGNPWAPILTITTLAYAGKKDEAKKIYAQVDSILSGKIPAIARGLIYHSFGDNKKAYEWLNRSYEDKDFYLISVKIDPLWDPLRSDPEFQKLKKKMNFPE